MNPLLVLAWKRFRAGFIGAAILGLSVVSGKAGDQAGNSWIATNPAPAMAPGSSFRGESDLTPSVTTAVPHYSDYTNAMIKLWLRRREPLILKAEGHAYYGGIILSAYDIRSLDPKLSQGEHSREELKAIWETNKPLLKGAYYRGRVLFFNQFAAPDEWVTVFASPDNQRLVFARDDGPIFYSENSGVRWKQITQPGTYEFTLASSPQGSVLVAGIRCEETKASAPVDTKMLTQDWYAVVSEANGSQMVISGGPTQSAPVLNIASADSLVLLTWPVTDISYRLQQTEDLRGANWSDVNDPVKTVEGINRVALSTQAGSRFFRLRTP